MDYRRLSFGEILLFVIIVWQKTSMVNADRLDHILQKHWHHCGQSLHNPMHRKHNPLIIVDDDSSSLKNNYSSDDQDDNLPFQSRFDFITKSRISCSLESKDDLRLSGRIVGGANAERFEFPWQISLRRYSTNLKKWYHSCGGVIIDSRWVLTAAHCVLGSKNPEWFRVRVGEYNYRLEEGTERDYNVSKIIDHTGFNFYTIEPDICLIKLVEDIDFEAETSNIRPICLPQMPDSLDENGTLALRSETESSGFQKPTTCASTGWGKTVFRESDDNDFIKDGEFPRILQKVCVNLVDINDCQKRYKEVLNITKTMLCSGEGGKGTCEGDSGGPLQCVRAIRFRNQTDNMTIVESNRWSLYGLTSWAIGCAEDQFPSVSVNVHSMREWISEQILKDRMEEEDKNGEGFDLPTTISNESNSDPTIPNTTKPTIVIDEQDEQNLNYTMNAAHK